MNKKKLFISIGLGFGILAMSLGLFIGNSQVALSDNDSKYLDREYKVRDSIKSSFNLDDQNLKTLFLRDIFDKSIASESDEVRSKLAKCYKMLVDDKEINKGDFKPIFFLNENKKVFIGIQHPDKSITLTEFDISKEKPEKVDKKVKEAK